MESVRCEIARVPLQESVESIRVTNQEELNALVAKVFQEFCADYCRRKEAKQATGCWYANDCFMHLGDKRKIDEYRRDGVFFSGLPPEGMDNRGEGIRWCYVISPGVKPSVIVSKAVSGKGKLCFIDCTMAMQLVFYEVIRRVAGDEAFDRQMSKEPGLDLAVCFEKQSLLYRFVSPLEGRTIKGAGKDAREVLVGHVYYIKNHPQYGEKHFGGEASGYNMLCISSERGRQRYVAFGVPGEGLSEDGFLELCAGEFNAPIFGEWEQCSEAQKALLRFALVDALPMKDRQTTPIEIEREGGGFQEGCPIFLSFKKLVRYTSSREEHK